MVQHVQLREPIVVASRVIIVFPRIVGPSVESDDREQFLMRVDPSTMSSSEMVVFSRSTLPFVTIKEPNIAL